MYFKRTLLKGGVPSESYSRKLPKNYLMLACQKSVFGH